MRITNTNKDSNRWKKSKLSIKFGTEFSKNFTFFRNCYTLAILFEFTTIVLLANHYWFMKVSTPFFLELNWFFGWEFSLSFHFHWFVEIVLVFSFSRRHSFKFFFVVFFCWVYCFLVFNWLYTFGTNVLPLPRGKFFFLYNTNTLSICAVCRNLPNTVSTLFFRGLSWKAVDFELECACELLRCPSVNFLKVGFYSVIVYKNGL